MTPPEVSRNFPLLLKPWNSTFYFKFLAYPLDFNFLNMYLLYRPAEIDILDNFFIFTFLWNFWSRVIISDVLYLALTHFNVEQLNFFLRISKRDWGEIMYWWGCWNTWIYASCFNRRLSTWIQWTHEKKCMLFLFSLFSTTLELILFLYYIKMIVWFSLWLLNCWWPIAKLLQIRVDIF